MAVTCPSRKSTSQTLREGTHNQSQKEDQKSVQSACSDIPCTANRSLLVLKILLISFRIINGVHDARRDVHRDGRRDGPHDVHDGHGFHHDVRGDLRDDHRFRIVEVAISMMVAWRWQEAATHDRRALY